MKQEITFSTKIKEELARHCSQDIHCQIAELSAIVSLCGKVSIDSRERYSVKVRTENFSVARKYFTLLRKTFNIETEVLMAMNKSNQNTILEKKDEKRKLGKPFRLYLTVRRMRDWYR